MKQVLLIGFLLISNLFWGQTITLHADTRQVLQPASVLHQPGTFFVPKNQAGYDALVLGNSHFQCIRLNIIESALNNSGNLNQCLTVLESYHTQVLDIAQKTDQLILIFEKMPAWLSSSSDNTPISSGWVTYNTKRPANWNTWQTVVDSIVHRININWGIHPYYEVWNEPDLFSWTGTQQEYLDLYRYTAAGVKSADASAPVGGAAVNFWAGQLGRQPWPGYITDAVADSSVLAMLIDSTTAWNVPLDFVSWHHFSYSADKEVLNCVDYLRRKFQAVNRPVVPFFVSEWNVPQALRETNLAIGYTSRVVEAFARAGLAGHAVAAWQDFNPASDEFHQDYGLVSTSALIKPMWNVLLLHELLKGTTVLHDTTADLFYLPVVTNDTLHVVVANPAIHPFYYCLYQTMFDHHVSLYQLDSAGYISVANNSVAHIDSIFQGYIAVTGSSTIDNAVNTAAQAYAQANSLFHNPQPVSIHFAGLQGPQTLHFFQVDSATNNSVNRYDSLIAAGYISSNAISYLAPTQQLLPTTQTFTDSIFNFTIQPHGVVGLELTGVPLGFALAEQENKTVRIFPQPASTAVTIETDVERIARYSIYNLSGEKLTSATPNLARVTYNTNALPNATYLMCIELTTGKVIWRKLIVAH